MKTLDEVKNDVAAVHGFKDWADCFNQMKAGTIGRGYYSILFDKVAKLYAVNALDDAILRTEICCNNFHPTVTLEQLTQIKSDLK